VSKGDALRVDLLRAIDRLDEACRRVAAATTVDPLVRDGLIQRFEFCFELAWKATQAAAAAEGVAVRSPKSAVAYALQVGWTADEPLWFRMLEARNLSSHTYDERIAEELAAEIPRYVPPLRALAQALPATSGAGGAG
jgi:nucleotidyltransferase substrate binding protein (TIGR01987 family)